MVSAPLTLQGLKLRGLVSANEPFFYFMYFMNNAGFVCEDCVVEFSCGGQGVDYFNDDLVLVRFPPYLSF